MPTFHYKAVNTLGASVAGSIEAGDSWLARKAIQKLELRVLELENASSVAIPKGFEKPLQAITKAMRAFGNRLPTEEKLIFTSQLETGISVGIPIVQLLESIAKETRHEGLRNAVTQIAQDIGQGAALHQAFAKHEQYFDSTYVGLIKTGELAGKLELVLGRIFRLLEQNAENEARIKSATFYPKIVVGFMIFVTLAVVYFVIPKIKVFLGSFGQELPPITQFVVSVSNFFTGYWYLVLVGALGIGFAFRRVSRLPAVSEAIDRTKLKLPVVGLVFTQIELNSFCVIMDLLLESGIPILDALDTIRGSQTNQIVNQELTRARAAVLAGSSLKNALAESTVFPSSLIGLIGIGEESGRLPEVLRRMGKHYQLQVDHKLDNLAKVIEPLLLAVIFVFTLVLALAVFLPIWKMSSAVRMNH